MSEPLKMSFGKPETAQGVLGASERQQRVLEFVKSNSFMSISEIADKLGLSTSIVSDEIEALEAKYPENLIVTQILGIFWNEEVGPEFFTEARYQKEIELLKSSSPLTMSEIACKLKVSLNTVKEDIKHLKTVHPGNIIVRRGYGVSWDESAGMKR